MLDAATGTGYMKLLVYGLQHNMQQLLIQSMSTLHAYLDYRSPSKLNCSKTSLGFLFHINMHETFKRNIICSDHTTQK